MLMSAELKGCVTWFIYFLDLLWVRYNCAKFHHCRICVTDFRGGGELFAALPIRERPLKSPSRIGLTAYHTYIRWLLDPFWFGLSFDASESTDLSGNQHKVIEVVLELLRQREIAYILRMSYLLRTTIHPKFVSNEVFCIIQFIDPLS